MSIKTFVHLFKKSFFLKWNEVSESYDDGADRRTFQICKIFESNPNYWFRTYYLPTYDAQTIYIEIKFAIRYSIKIIKSFLLNRLNGTCNNQIVILRVICS